MYDFDVTKLCVFTRDIGLDGIEVYDILRDEYDIQIEFGDIGNILAYISIGDRIQDIERLMGALADISRLYKKEEKRFEVDREMLLPRVLASPQEAFYANKEKVPIREAAGRISGEFVMAYPPGIPIVAPGEEITEDIIDYILYSIEKGCPCRVWRTRRLSILMCWCFRMLWKKQIFVKHILQEVCFVNINSLQ